MSAESKRQVELDALRLLANDDELRMPDPSIERRVLDSATSLGSRTLPRWARVAAIVLVTLSLTGGAMAATGALERLASWWYSIRVDDDLVETGTSDGGARDVEFTTDDGVRVQVRIERDRPTPDSSRTRVDVSERSADGKIEFDTSDETQIGAMELTQTRIDASRLAGSKALHMWTGPDGARHELHLLTHGAGTRIVVLDVDDERPDRARVVQDAARPIRRGGTVNVVEHDGGFLEIELDDGAGWALIIGIGAAPPGRESTHTFESPSGRVKVDVGDDR